MIIAMKKKAEYENISNLIGFYFADQDRINKYARITENGALPQRDSLRKRIYRWENVFCREAKLLPIKKNSKPHSLEYCKKYLNKIIKKEFYRLWKLNPSEARETYYYNRHTRLLPKLIFDEILPYWEKKFSKKYSDVGLTFRKKGEQKSIIVDIKTFKKYRKIKGPINNKRLKEYVESKSVLHDDIYLCSFNKAVMYGSDKVKLYYAPHYAVIRMPHLMRRKKVMLHELAHLLCNEWERHTPTFATILAYLYNKYLNVDYRAMYASSFFNSVALNEKHSFFMSEKVTRKKMRKYFESL